MRIYKRKDRKAVIKYIGKRFLQLIPILFGITFITFTMMNTTAVDTVDKLLENTGSVVSQEVEESMKQYGETIYGTRGGVVAPHDWGVTTQKGNKLYVHILDLKDKALFLPLTDKKVKKAVVFKDQSPVRLTKTKAGVLLEFAEVPKDIDYVVELTID